MVNIATRQPNTGGHRAVGELRSKGVTTQKDSPMDGSLNPAAGRVTCHPSNP